MSLFTPPPLRPKCARPTGPGFKRLQRRGVYIVMFTSMAFIGFVGAGIALLLSWMFLWSWFEQTGHPYWWTGVFTFIGFMGGARIGNWSGRMVIMETMKQTQERNLL